MPEFLRTARRWTSLALAGLSLVAGAARAATQVQPGLDAPGSVDDVAGLFWDDFESGSVCFWSGRSGYDGACLYDFSCFGDTPPTSAADPLAVSGTLADLDTLAPIAGAAAEARLVADSSLLDEDTTAADGSFALSLATGGSPVDAFLAFAAGGYPTTRYFVSDPLAADATALAARAISASQLGLIYFFANVAQLPGTGTAVVVVVDCAGTPIEGASVALTPAPTALRYLAGSLPSPSATATDASGVALGLSAPAGGCEVAASYGGRPLETHAFQVFAGGVSATPIHP